MRWLLLSLHRQIFFINIEEDFSVLWRAILYIEYFLQPFITRCKLVRFIFHSSLILRGFVARNMDVHLRIVLYLFTYTSFTSKVATNRIVWETEEQLSQLNFADPVSLSCCFHSLRNDRCFQFAVRGDIGQSETWLNENRGCLKRKRMKKKEEKKKKRNVKGSEIRTRLHDTNKMKKYIELNGIERFVLNDKLNKYA